MRGILASSSRLRTVEWRDLLVTSPGERIWELIISLPWLLGALACYQVGWYWLGALCSFYFFLTGLRQSHGAQHYTLGLPHRVQDAALFVLSALMLASMHAVQVSHLHHHRHCLDSDDTEGSTAGLPWWQALLVGPLFPIRLHRTAWRLASAAKRRWIVAELVAIVLLVLTVTVLPSPAALQWHVMAMVVGESLTGFFAVWTVHHGCDPAGLFARTQRGRLFTWLSYSMFFHAEHHLFPLVPTCRLARLAERLDAIAPDLQWQPVIGGAKGPDRFDQPNVRSCHASPLGEPPSSPTPPKALGGASVLPVCAPK